MTFVAFADVLGYSELNTIAFQNMMSSMHKRREESITDMFFA